MILRAIRLSGWRCYAAPLELGPFADGINVIHAANGVGKSTLFEALQRGLLDSHRVQGKPVQDLRPWGRDLSPSVTVEFVHEGTDYRIEKQFLSGAASVLQRRENGSFTPLAESREADTRVREMLLGEAAPRGLTKPAQWGLAQVLWVPQGDLAFDELSGNLTKTISEALGTQLTGIEGGVLDLSEEDWDAVINVNVKGTFLACKHAIPAMIAGGGGAIVNVGSIQSYSADSASLVYTASKAAILTLTRNIALRFADRGIRANTVCPGDCETPLVEALFERNEGMREEIAAKYPMGRLARPIDIANAVLFLVSDEAAFATGTELTIDGGFLAR